MMARESESFNDIDAHYLRKTLTYWTSCRSAADPRLAPALQAVHARAAHPRTVQDLARLCHMSRATFARVFHQALGQAPTQYLTGRRMTLARDLLPAQQAPIDQIAAQTGCSTACALAAAFRRHHGEPPRRWQQRELAAVAAGSAGHGIHP
jgi:transcriptional regulator GlxA family with amidase domain